MRRDLVAPALVEVFYRETVSRSASNETEEERAVTATLEVSSSREGHLCG